MKRRSFLAASGAIAASSLLPTLGQAQTANPLVAPWTGPFGGVPPFDKVRVEDFSPAMDAAMAANIRKVVRAAYSGSSHGSRRTGDMSSCERGALIPPAECATRTRTATIRTKTIASYKLGA